MKGHLKNKPLIFSLFFVIFIFQFGRSQSSKNDFYDFFDKQIEVEYKYEFLLISLSKECDGYYLFSISPRSYNSLSTDKYYIFEYKGIPIIYEINSTNRRIKNASFFKKYFKKGNFNVNILEKTDEYDADKFALIFKNNKIVTNHNDIKNLIERICNPCL